MGRKLLISNTSCCSEPFRYNRARPKMLSRVPRAATRRTGHSRPRMAPRRRPETTELREVWAAQLARRRYRGRGRLARALPAEAFRALSGHPPAWTPRFHYIAAERPALPDPMSSGSLGSTPGRLQQPPGRRRGLPCAHEDHRPDGRGSGYRSSHASGGHGRGIGPYPTGYGEQAQGLRQRRRKTTGGLRLPRVGPSAGEPL